MSASKPIEEPKTVTRQIEEIAEKMCTEYCKWPARYADDDELHVRHCDECPLNLL